MINIDFSVCSMYRADFPRSTVYIPWFLEESAICSVPCYLSMYAAWLLNPMNFKIYKYTKP